MATSVVSWVMRCLRALVKRSLRHRPVPAPSAFEPTKFADTQDLLDDVRATEQTRGIEVRESELGNLPPDVQRHFRLESPTERA